MSLVQAPMRYVSSFLSLGFSFIHKPGLICSMKLQAMKWRECFSAKKIRGWRHPGDETRLPMSLWAGSSVLQVSWISYSRCWQCPPPPPPTKFQSQKWPWASSLNLPAYRWGNWGSGRGRDFLKFQSETWWPNRDFFKPRLPSFQMKSRSILPVYFKLFWFWLRLRNIL